jgi:hypothetical protein
VGESPTNNNVASSVCSLLEHYPSGQRLSALSI